MGNKAKAQNTIKIKIKIDWSGLEAFRKTLPEYRRHEYFRFLAAGWDLVKVQYLLTQRPHEQHSLRLANAPKVYGFEEPESSLYRFDTASAEDERVDLTRPVILAMIAVGNGKEEQLVIDGLNRMYKGWKNGVASIPCYILSSKEEMLCRVR